MQSEEAVMRYKESISCSICLSVLCSGAWHNGGAPQASSQARSNTG